MHSVPLYSEPALLQGLAPHPQHLIQCRALREDEATNYASPGTWVNTFQSVTVPQSEQDCCVLQRVFQVQIGTEARFGVVLKRGHQAALQQCGGQKVGHAPRIKTECSKQSVFSQVGTC